MQDESNAPVSTLQVAKEVATDPGVGFNVVASILFAGGNPVGLVACLVATGLSGASKVLALKQPKFLKQHPKLAQIISDNRTPLRVCGLALLLTAGAALATGALLPAAASAIFSIGNFKIAESISATIKEGSGGHDKEAKQDKSRPSLKKLASLALKGPSLYISLGLALAGLMAGGASLVVLPVVATALAVSLNNGLKNKGESAGHPTAINAGATAVFAAVGVASGNLLPAIAFLLNTMILLNVEARVTKGGFSQVLNERSTASNLCSPQKQTLWRHPLRRLF
jgi:hypothetical protein